MQEQKKVELIKNDGTKTSIELISLFKIKKNDVEKKYALLTANEVDQNGLIKILAAEIIDGKLEKIVDPTEWTVVKNVMRAIISSSKGDYEYLNPGDIVLSYVVSDNFARIIAVQESAKMQLIKDYEENKPAPDEIETPNPEEKVKNPNEIIYPTPEENNSGNEVSPGISETQDIKPIDIETNNQQQTSEETKNEDNSEQTLSKNVTGNSSINNEFVSNVEAAPLKDIVGNFQEKPSTVNEYLDSIKENKNDSLEITALKTNINVMQEQLDKINKTLNTRE